MDKERKQQDTQPVSISPLHDGEYLTLLSEAATSSGTTPEEIALRSLRAYLSEDLSDGDKYRLSFYRNEVVHEFNLLSQRLLWYVTCMSLLITSIAIVMATSEWIFRREFSLCLIFLGLLISLLTHIAVRHTIHVLDEWHRKKYTELIGGIDILNPGPHHKKWIPYLVRRRTETGGLASGRDYTHTESLWVSKWMPALFGIVLIILGILVWRT